MAINIENKITGQDVGGTPRYFYLYEPLPILISLVSSEATKINVSVKLKDVNDGSVIQTLNNYAVYDIPLDSFAASSLTTRPIDIDLMRIVRQIHDSDLWKFTDIFDITEHPEAIVSKYQYDFEVLTDDVNDLKVSARVIPIIGGRMFCDFQPLPLDTGAFVTFPLNDFEVNEVEIAGRWKDFPTIRMTLTPPDSSVPKVNLFSVTTTTGQCAEGGMLFWKSRLGGWMQWGFDIKTLSKKVKYRNDIEVDMFDTLYGEVNQDPFIPTDYSKVDYSYTMTLKSLSLTQEELAAVSSISESPICYYAKDPDSRLELMRITSATTPQNNLANGGDFVVSLKNISQTTFKTR